MTPYETYSILFQILDLILGLSTFIGSIIVIIFTYENLKEMRNQLAEQQKQYFEQNRGNLIFYISKNGHDFIHSLIIKNFGSSPAKLLSLKITPELDWNRIGENNINQFNITNLKNIFLAPKQHVSSIFDFRSYPDQQFQIEISYETCGKIITENYSIDLDYTSKLLSLHPDIKDEKHALECINDSIISLSDKFI